MPVMGGIEATEKILSMSLVPGKLPPVIVALTAHVFKEDQQRCLRAGMTGVLTKPIRRPELQAMLERIERERYKQPLEETPAVP
jgi:CheY-like chemotaxis protein